MKYTEIYHQIQVWKEVIGLSIVALIILSWIGIYAYINISYYFQQRRRK
jgi:hypothetical protein